MPELAEVAFACGKWNPGIGKFIKQVYANPSSRVYRDLLQEDVVSELTKAKISLSATHGKQMLFKLSGNKWLGIHLGMTGSLHISSSNYQSHKHDALILFQSKQALIFETQDNLAVCVCRGKTAPTWWSDFDINTRPKFKLSVLSDALSRHGKRPIKAFFLTKGIFKVWETGWPMKSCGVLNSSRQNRIKN